MVAAAPRVSGSFSAVPPAFSHFVGIDWSGAKGVRHPGLAVAVCEIGQGAPSLIMPPSGKTSWSRQECSDWIAGRCGLGAEARILVGIDSSFSMPFVDQGHYLDETQGVSHARALWKCVESHSRQGVDLYGGAFVMSHRCHYHLVGARGTRYSRRMRVTETRAVESGAGPCESVFHLIGPSQVGLSGLSTMRMLAQLDGLPGLAVWPYDDVSEAGLVLTEIYAAAFATLGHHRGKIRDRKNLNRILSKLESSSFRGRNIKLTDHVCDALVTSAALRHVAGHRKYWHPELLSATVRETEGWVFGIA